MIKHTRWYNDNNQKDDDANDDTNSHLHVFPPHLFPDSVRTFSERLRLMLQMVGLVLKGVKVFATLPCKVHVFFHYIHCIINFLVTIEVSSTPEDEDPKSAG